MTFNYGVDYTTEEDIVEGMVNINAEEKKIIRQAEVEKRDLTSEDLATLNKYMAAFDRLEKEKKELETMQNTSMGRKTAPEDPQTRNTVQPIAAYGAAARVTTDNVTERVKYLMAVKNDANARRNGGLVDRESEQILKFYNAPTTYGTEGIPADGGFAVPPEWAKEIWVKMVGEIDLARYCDTYRTASNNFNTPKDEAAPWGSTGIQAYWEGEASALTESKPALEAMSQRLNKVSALVPVSDELLEDAVGLMAYFNRKVPTIFNWKLSNAIINGSGVGRPLGILNSGCLISVAKESGQAADTVLASNILTMWSRMYAPCRQNAVWVYNQDIEPQLLNMTMLNDAGNPVPVFLPGNNLSGRPFNTIMGAPAIAHQACQTVGDKGDLFFLDLTQYQLVTRVEGLKQDVSIHLYFNYDMTAFRWVLRVTGQPWWRTSITPASGSANTLSCFVTLDERAAG